MFENLCTSAGFQAPPGVNFINYLKYKNGSDGSGTLSNSHANNATIPALSPAMYIPPTAK